MTIRQDQHDTIVELRREVAHWKANHDHQVERARILMERPDLPIERVEAYKKWQECEAELAAIKSQEPVAFVCKTNNGTLYLEWPENIEPQEEWTKVYALYTHPAPSDRDAFDREIAEECRLMRCAAMEGRVGNDHQP